MDIFATISGAVTVVGLATKYQKDLVENIEKYYAMPFDKKAYERKRALSLIALVLPLIYLLLCIILLPNISVEYIKIVLWTGVLIIAFFITGLRFALRLNGAMTHTYFLQNPKKEQLYRWNYCLVFEDEFREYKQWVKRSIFHQPGISEPVILMDRHTYKITCQIMPNQLMHMLSENDSL